MKPEEIVEMIGEAKEYKEMFDILLDTYGSDVEGYVSRLMRASARLQRNYYDELVKEGFTELQAFTLLLDGRNAIKSIDLASR